MPLSVVKWVRLGEVTHGIAGDEESRDVPYRADLSDPVADQNSDEGDRIILDAANANAPILWDGLPRANISIQQLTPKIFQVTVRYSRKQQSDNQKARAGAKFSFDISVDNSRVYVARSQQRFPSGTAVDYKNFINVVHDDDKVKVEGADYPFPKQEFELSFNADHTFFTTTYLTRCEMMVSLLNDHTFFQRPRGSIMFMGIRGTVENTGMSEISYRFQYRRPPKLPKSIAGITIPGGTDIIGWDVIWPKNGPEATNIDQLGAAAEGLYAARCGQLWDFRWLGLDPTDPLPGNAVWVDPD